MIFQMLLNFCIQIISAYQHWDRFVNWFNIFLFNIDNIKHNSKEYIHLISEIEKRVYADRAKYLGDMDYYNVPIHDLMNFEYNSHRASEIDIKKATDSNDILDGVGDRVFKRVQQV